MKQQSSLVGDILSTIVLASIIPGITFILYLFDIIVLRTCQLIMVGFFLLFIAAPLIYKLSYRLQRQSIFLNYLNIPLNASFDNPIKHGLDSTRNFYISTDDDVQLGMWHILPNDLTKDDDISDEEFEQLLTSGHPIIVYMHGNSGNRAADHRVELYKILRKRFHVIAFDYRGYGDSSNVDPTENGVVKDGVTVIQWVKNITNSRVYVWGHSLGTGVSCHALHLLSLEKVQVSGLILESPFTNVRQEVREHPSAMLFKNLPWFRYTVVDAIYNNGFRFESDEHILHIDCPILILHAEDDFVVPFKLGYKLYTIASEKRTKNQGKVYFEKFSEKLNYGHKHIYKYPQLFDIIDQIIKKE